MNRNPTVAIQSVDYDNTQQANDLRLLIDHYSRDPMGSRAPLPQSVLDDLIPAMKQRPHVGSAIAYVDGKPAGLINFVEGFSTFAARPLINIHDLVVHREHRGRGLSRLLLQHVEDEAIARGCCKLTLEVLSDNAIAKAAYDKFGFQTYRQNDQSGPAEFWQKKID